MTDTTNREPAPIGSRVRATTLTSWGAVITEFIGTVVAYEHDDEFTDMQIRKDNGQTVGFACDAAAMAGGRAIELI